jgi:hypothetical protein
MQNYSIFHKRLREKSVLKFQGNITGENVSLRILNSFHFGIFKSQAISLDNSSSKVAHLKSEEIDFCFVLTRDEFKGHNNIV